MADEKRGISVRLRKDIEAILKSLGSTASEIKVFSALTKLRRYATVKEIEEATGLSEKSVRSALKKLEKKGLVVSKEREGRRVYRPVSVNEIIEVWKKKVEETLSTLFRRP